MGLISQITIGTDSESGIGTRDSWYYMVNEDIKRSWINNSTVIFIHFYFVSTRPEHRIPSPEI